MWRNLTLIFFTCISALVVYCQKYVVSTALKAVGYDAHVEISFNNPTGFVYELYLLNKEGKEFSKRAKISSGFYIDFVGEYGKNLHLIYCLVPNGMDVNTKEASKYKIYSDTHKFTNDQLLDMVQRYSTRYFYDAFNFNMVTGQQVVHSYLAIDQGSTEVMIENYRSGLIWKLFMQNEEIHNGLKKMGFWYET